MNATRTDIPRTDTTAPALGRPTRLASMALAAVLTFATLAGVDGLAQGDADGAQLATQTASPGTPRG